MTQIYRQTNESAGADLSASEDVVINAGEIVLVPTGYHLPFFNGTLCNTENLYYLLAARSSLAYKKGLILANGVGIIDSDYEDEVKVMLYNSTNSKVSISKGERIAQLIPSYFIPMFPSLDNGRNGGFGSTGDK